MTIINALFLSWLCLWLISLWRSFNAFEHLADSKLKSYEIVHDKLSSGATFSELSNRINEIEKLPSGFEKFQKKQAVIKEIELLLANQPKLQENLPDNIVYFRQSNS